MTQKLDLIKTVLLTAGILTAWQTTPQAQAVSLTTLVSFNSTNGANPSAALAQGPDGNFYGTTSAGGTNGLGTVFQMTPSGGPPRTLVSFNGTNGASPWAGLTLGQDGSLYGATTAGGTNGRGTAFRVTTNGGFSTLATFDGTNGASPYASLVRGNDGYFYGTTELGGLHGGGAAFQMATNGALTNVFSFDNRGYNLYGGLAQGVDGDFYGATYQGGTNGVGTIYKLTTAGEFTPLYCFTGGSDGSYPYASLARAADGAFYGTTYYGGSNGLGTVFKLTTDNGFSSLLSFNGTNGAYPYAGLIPGADGNLYGTTENGGAYTNRFGTGYGTVFRVTTNGALTTLVSFNSTNGSFPQAGLVQGADGNLYGATAYGGASDNGTIFRVNLVTPPAPVIKTVTQTGGAITLTWSAVVGQSYQLVSETNLTQPAWKNVGGVILATNATMSVSDTIGSDPQRFYRVALVQ